MQRLNVLTIAHVTHLLCARFANLIRPRGVIAPEPRTGGYMKTNALHRWAAATFIVAVALPVCAQVQLPDPVYQVRMSASYEPEGHQVRGVEKIRWRNTSSAPIEELEFHLYLNAFSNNMQFPPRQPPSRGSSSASRALPLPPP